MESIIHVIVPPRAREVWSTTSPPALGCPGHGESSPTRARLPGGFLPLEPDNGIMVRQWERRSAVKSQLEVQLSNWAVGCNFHGD